MKKEQTGKINPSEGKLNYYLKEVKDVLKALNTTENGLSGEEAAQRLTKDGKNKLSESKKTPLIKRFLSQLVDPMIIMLLAAAVISGATAAYAGESFADVFIILFVVIVNAVLGVVQESKAEAAIDALKEMTAAESRVMRDGSIVIIKSEDLVKGDIISLEAGDAVPADCRIIESASLKIEEAALTGESVPVTKMMNVLGVKDGEMITLGDRKNMAYTGSTVVYGRGRAVVTATAMETEMGKIATALEQTTDGQTPLQIKLAEISKILTKLVLGICVFIFGFTLIRNGDFSVGVLLSTFMTAVSLAVAAIPEGLPAVVTIVLSVGVTTMSKRNALIRKLTAVETLCCTQIIFSDKTGTLTQNKMTVVEYYSGNERLLAKAMALCSDAEIKQGEEAVGEPTEAALVNYADSLGMPKPNLKEVNERIGEAPFDSVRKMMSTVHKTDDDKIVQYTKGAPEEVLKRCVSYFEKGKALPLTQEKRKEILERNKVFADSALRVLAAAYKVYDDVPSDFEPETLECDMVFIGLTGMMDPCRSEVYDAIKECRAAGIRPIMITGDHKDTAVAIAKKLGMIKDDSEAITGAELEKISDEDFAEAVKKYSVYARVQPEHKTRIVNAWKAQGMVTAMTGDGVNDAPSIKSADIGLGMGITGTDVTKNVSDMVLADDNFATIISAVEEGRRIYDNIRKVIQFQLSTNFAEVASVFISSVLGFTILNPAHLLWVNMVTDCTPGLALGMENAEDDIMLRKPRPADESVFSDGAGLHTILQGLYMTLIVLASYFIGHYIECGRFVIENSADGMTMAFLTLSMTQIFHAFNSRSQKQSIFKLKHQNWYLVGAGILSLILTTIVIYVPAFTKLFGFTEISLYEYGVAMLLAVSIIPVMEIAKAIIRAAKSNKQ